MKYYYQRLRDLREDGNRTIKQEEIAALLETTQQTYSLWERGEREIPFHYVITLAKFYNVSLDYIAGLTNNKKANEPLAVLADKFQFIELFEMMQRTKAPSDEGAGKNRLFGTDF